MQNMFSKQNEIKLLLLSNITKGTLKFDNMLLNQYLLLNSRKAWHDQICGTQVRRNREENV